ncbi:MAG: DMT family transporter [bacterium]|nr:DMT family transporter [bacterium]
MSHTLLAAILGMFFFGVADFLLKKGLNKGLVPEVFFFYAILIAAIPFGIMCLYGSISLSFQGPVVQYSLGIALFVFIASFALLASLKVGDASIVVPIVRMGLVITVILAFIFLHEAVTVTKILGILAAIVAIILLSKE